MKAVIFAILFVAPLCGMRSGLADSQGPAASIYDLCWSAPWPKPWLHGLGRNFNPQPVRLTIRNPSDEYLEICVYDRVCGQFVYSDSLRPRVNVRLLVCADQNRRGAIFVLDRAGAVLPFQDLQSRTIDLPVKRR